MKLIYVLTSNLNMQKFFKSMFQTYNLFYIPWNRITKEMKIFYDVRVGFGFHPKQLFFAIFHFVENNFML